MGLRVLDFACAGCALGVTGEPGADGWEAGELIGDEPGVRARAAAKPGLATTFGWDAEPFVVAGGAEVWDVNGCAANGLNDWSAAWVVMVGVW
jgi:hypothetical protein